MRTFHLVRDYDVSGVSGTGVVAEGVVYSDGKVSMRWCTKDNPHSTTVYDSIEDVLSIHGHVGLTQVIYEPDAKEALREIRESICAYDPKDEYEQFNPARHVPGFSVGYFAGIDRAVEELNDKIATGLDGRVSSEDQSTT